MKYAQPSVAQALHIANGDTVNKKLSAKESVVTKLLDAGAPDEKLIEEASLTCLSRLPTAKEMERFLQALADTKDSERRTALEDIFWAMLSRPTRSSRFAVDPTSSRSACLPPAPPHCQQTR